MWIFTNGINIGASRLIGDAVYNDIKESRSFRNIKNVSECNLNVVGISREDHLRYGESIGNRNKTV